MDARSETRKVSGTSNWRTSTIGPVTSGSCRIFMNAVNLSGSTCRRNLGVPLECKSKFGMHALGIGDLHCEIVSNLSLK